MQRAPHAGSWTREWITRWDDVWTDCFAARWRDWIEDSSDSHVFFEPSVVRAWYEAYRKLRRIEPRFFIARSSTGATFFLPLVLDSGNWKDAWRRIIRPVGFSEFDYHDPIVVGATMPSDWRGFWQVFECEMRNLGRTIDASVLPRLSASHPPDQNCVEAIKAPFLDVSGQASIDELLGSVSTHVRQELRRQPRRLSKIGDLSMRVFRQHEAEGAQQQLAGLLAAHGTRWPKAYRANGFLENLIRLCVPNGLLHLSILSCGRHRISWHLGFTHRRRFYYYLPAFDAGWSTYSPGKLHLAHLIEWAFARGFEVFDFLSGEEPYKYQWTSRARPLHRWSIETQGVLPRSKKLVVEQLRPMVLATRRQLVQRPFGATRSKGSR